VKARAGSVDAILRAMRFIESLAQNIDGLTVTELADAEQENKALTHRALISLVDAGYVEQDKASERYRLTGRLFAVALSYYNKAGLQRLLSPLLRDLAQETRCAVEYTRTIDGEVRILISVQPSGGLSGLQVVSRVGDVQAAHATAAGKVWLAHLAPNELDEYLLNRSLAKRTDYTITDPKRLRAEIERVRRAGCAFNRRESADWVFALAVPVITAGGSQFLGAVGLVRPQASRRASDEKQLVRSAQNAASEMARLVPPWGQFV
jgi:DNA-binding IclR family transcriptional regulator